MRTVPMDLNSASHDWVVRDAGDEIVTLQCRDTGELTTIHRDELEAMGASRV